MILKRRIRTTDSGKETTFAKMNKILSQFKRTAATVEDFRIKLMARRDRSSMELWKIKISPPSSHDP